MDRFNIPLTAERLTAYAVERQSGTERHQPEGTPPPAELRRFWTDAILQGMARLEGLTPASKWMDQYDQQLVSAPMIKCKKTPRKKCRFVAEEAKKR